MADQEIAPPTESWPEHLKDLGDRDLADLAKDYRWLDDEASAEEKQDFHQRRQAVLDECKRRGLTLEGGL